MAKLSIEGRVVMIAPNRPDKLNAFDIAMHAQLADCCDTIEADDEVRVFIFDLAM